MDETGWGYRLLVGLDLRLADACKYAGDRDLGLPEALAELINKGLSYA